MYAYCTYGYVIIFTIIVVGRAILICCGGFGDNGRMFQEYGAFFESKEVKVLSFTFPGTVSSNLSSCLFD
jgi:hypothetical protein